MKMFTFIIEELLTTLTATVYTYGIVLVALTGVTVCLIAPVVALKNEFSCEYLEEDQFVQHWLTKVGTALALLVMFLLCSLIFITLARTVMFNNQVLESTTQIATMLIQR